MHHVLNEEWLSLLTVPSHCWHHYGLVAASDWIAFFVWVLNWVAVLHQVLCFYNHMKKTIILGPFYCFKSKRLLRMNLMRGNTENISHVAILTWPGMTSSLTSHRSVNDITQRFSFNSFLVLSLDTKMSHLKRRWKVSRANQSCGNLPFISINVSFRNTVSLKTFPWIFHHPIFIKNTSTFHVSNGVDVRFVHRAL